MHRDAGALTGGIKARQEGVLFVNDHPPFDVGRNAAHGIVGRRLHGHWLQRRVDAQIGPAEIGDVWQFGLDDLPSQVAGIQVYVILAIDAPPGLDFQIDGPGNDVTGRQVEQCG